MALCLIYELHFAGRYACEEGVALKRRLEQDFAQYRRQEAE